VLLNPVYLENVTHVEGNTALLECLVMQYAAKVANMQFYIAKRIISYNRCTLKFHPISMSNAIKFRPSSQISRHTTSAAT